MQLWSFTHISYIYKLSFVHSTNIYLLTIYVPGCYAKLWGEWDEAVPTPTCL